MRGKKTNPLHPKERQAKGLKHVPIQTQMRDAPSFPGLSSQDDFLKISGINFVSDDYHECEDATDGDSSCNREGICRCGIVVGATPYNIKYPVLARIFYDQTDPMTIDAIAIILEKTGFTSASTWNFTAEDDYYGQVLSSVTLNKNTAIMCNVLITRLLQHASPIDQLNFANNLT